MSSEILGVRDVNALEINLSFCYIKLTNYLFGISESGTRSQLLSLLCLLRTQKEKESTDPNGHSFYLKKKAPPFTIYFLSLGISPSPHSIFNPFFSY